jgi:hypothetical protein
MEYAVVHDSPILAVRNRGSSGFDFLGTYEDQQAPKDACYPRKTGCGLGEERRRVILVQGARLIRPLKCTDSSFGAIGEAKDSLPPRDSSRTEVGIQGPIS